MIRQVRLRMRVCRRCNNFYNSTGKFSRICPKCTRRGGNPSYRNKK